ncbi:ferric-dicitrate binding protein FerR (iron transport regulator) [Dysgonomonas sp. PFB1-18]|uniref:FecR family protein n=1 Tax=unclassified Dysgonomonas TaxID=2630389 RepID=UPI0024735E17|nr:MULTISPECIES: FecR family protein [unclassified Dysgonomonas]MDH6310236.1 ferric-dicitrate binding protein FerR (iron transport regulator) [Dysgonomonas sp. PF1-14]MDH6340055.1 ferric-dicitrate binding protein FerR (iron transport regulator) [Dysgonomonas sp. PF1-16]MDH6381838.1 ferric-dicitrate binding protein FerR (iron transport regulator) [Dysgonomonas sp. PFB1-18]MDH6398920.1 ferric-dicitrate binding protein FerR (iron transport regulator) [Dysgonomonas sp. PF1-23]
MTLDNKNDKFTDQAWNKLYSRLEQNGLLADATSASEDRGNIIHEEARESIQLIESIGLKWVISIAAILTGVFILVHILSDTIPDRKMFTLHNEKDAPTLVTTLEDGSVMYISELTSIQYPIHFEADKREINLQGEAFFEISKNKDRPFFIDTELATIEVLGTAFNVDSKDKSYFSLSVKHGEVRVTMKENSRSVNVKAGERALIQSGQLRTEQFSETHLFDSYFRQIRFKDERLANVIHAINMNSDSVQLKVSPALENRLLTMTITNDSPDTTAELISMALNLQLIREKNVITIVETK